MTATPPFEWNFEPRAVNYSVSVRAVFHPSIGAATVSLPFIDASGARAAAPVVVGPLSTLEPEAPHGCQDGAGTGEDPRWPGAIRVFGQKPLGSFPTTLALVRGLQGVVLPVGVNLGAAEHEAARSDARIHLGPLLLANGAGEGGSTSPGARGGDAGEDEPSRQEVRQQQIQEAIRRASPLGDVAGAVLRPSDAYAAWTETIGVAGLYLLEVCVFTDIPVLSVEMQNRLFPACFVVEAVRGLPNEPGLEDTCNGVHVDVYPELSACTRPLAQQCGRRRSADRPHNTMAHFFEPVVWLLGLSTVHVVREWLQHEALIVEVHDRDLRAAGGDAAGGDATAAKPSAAPDDEEHARAYSAVEHPHGVAHFKLAPLLESLSLEVSLVADVFPARGNKKRRKAERIHECLPAAGLLTEDGAAKIIERIGDGKREDTTDYHSCGTVCTVRASLAVALPAARTMQAADEEKRKEKWTRGEQHDGGEGNIWVATRSPTGATASKSLKAAPLVDEDAGYPPSPTPFRAKLKLASGEELTGPWRKARGDAEEDESHLKAAALADDEQPDEDGARTAAALLTRTAGSGVGLDCRHERYGRAVFVLMDGDSSSMRALLRGVRTRNGEELGIDPVAEAFKLATYELSETEKADPHLDILTGFSVMDGLSKVVVVEGLRERGLRELLDNLPPEMLNQPNNETFKLLHNPSVGFSERLYADFGPKVKQIKIRLPLEKLSSKSGLYSFSGVLAEGTKDGMEAPKLVMDLKRLQTLRSLRHGAGANFPRVSHLANLEILFGGYVTDEELDGAPSRRPGTSISRGTKRSVGRSSRASLLVTGSQPGECLEDAVTDSDGEDLAEFATSKYKAPGRRDPLHMKNDDFEGTLTLRKAASEPNFQSTNRAAVKVRSEENVRVNDILGKKRHRETPFLEGVDVFNYSTQRLNCTELQKDYMRATMDPQQDKKMWTYCPSYSSCDFSFGGTEPPGVKSHHSSCAPDTYANHPGDTRPVYRQPPARSREDFRKPGRDLGVARPEELHEAFAENEWHNMAIGDERRKPLAVHVRFEPDKIPHHRRITERPFDPTKLKPEPKEFGPKSMFESVNYHGRPPGETRGAEALKHNVAEQAKEKASIRSHTQIRSFSQGATRKCVVDTDRHEDVAKDKYRHMKPGLEHTYAVHPSTMYTQEKYHEQGRPDKDHQARLRENDSSAPFDVATGCYMARDHAIGEKKAVMSGTLGKAPWRHMTNRDQTTRAKFMDYPAMVDFDTTRQPPKSRICENQCSKNASRSFISDGERTKQPYRRPADYGVSLHAS